MGVVGQGAGGLQTREGFDFAFACKRSGNCCAIPGGVVRLDDEDVQRVAAYLEISEDALRSRYLEPDGVTLKNGLGNRCVFLCDGGEAACSIYSVRPEQCRQWPFWPKLRADPELLAQARRMCPGIEDR